MQRTKLVGALVVTALLAGCTGSRTMQESTAAGGPLAPAGAFASHDVSMAPEGGAGTLAPDERAFSAPARGATTAIDAASVSLAPLGWATADVSYELDEEGLAPAGWAAKKVDHGDVAPAPADWAFTTIDD